MSGWTTVTKKSSNKPRNKPVAKREVVLPLEDFTDSELEVYNVLKESYPNTMSCEDILAALVRKGSKLIIDRIWEMLDDEDRLGSITVDPRRNRHYRLKTQ